MENTSFFILPDPEVEKEKESLQEMREKIKSKEKNVKRLEKEKQQKRAQRIGEIAADAGIHVLDDNVLRGAFLAIAAKREDIEQLSEWKRKGAQMKREAEVDG